MAEDFRLLLAMRHVAGSCLPALAKSLDDEARLPALRGDPRWAPGRIDWEVAERQWAAICAMGLTVVPQWRLPARFLAASPPLALFVRGDAGALWRDAIGIVGSRNCAASAEGWAAQRAIEAADRGLLVVSGGARGVDGAAHRAATAAGAPSVAYLGVAADRIYPVGHRFLFRRMIEIGGALVSEFPPGAGTRAWAHRLRNRFIAAHSDLLYIAEADAHSGTLGTADWARRLGVPVLASPPSIGRRRAGLEALIAAGEAELHR